jgi:hypothetical protein
MADPKAVALARRDLETYCAPYGDKMCDLLDLPDDES